MKMRTDDPALVPLEPNAIARRWQEEVMLAIRKYLAMYQAVLVSAATGTGKGTLIASAIVKAVRAGRRCLFLCHRDELIDDVMNRAMRIEPALYAGKVKGKVNEVDRHAVFASVQSLKGKRLDDLPPFDFVFTDEAHHATAKTYRAIYARTAELNPRRKHIGFTATPFRSASSGKTSGLGATFEALIYEYSLADAITEGALSPIRGIRVETQLDLSDVDPDDEEKLARIVDTDERNEVVLQKYLEHLSGKPAIGFASSVGHAIRLAELFRGAGVRADAVWESSKVHGPDKRRAEKIAAYQRGEIDVLFNRDLLAEGFDAPATAGVLLVRPTKSRGLYAQMVGRATRLSPATGKTEGLILDFVDNSETHDLASLSDLTTPEKKQRIEPGAIVRHRRLAELSEGMAEEVVGETVESLKVRVSWRGSGGEQWHPEDDLVLLRCSRGSNEILITPSVIGVSEFSVQLFGGRKIGWYTYEGSRGKVLVARGKGKTSALIRHCDTGDGEWEAWVRRDDDVERVAIGSFQEVEAAVKIKPEPYNSDKNAWMTDPMTDSQRDTLRKFGLGKREQLSKGEASLLIEMKIIGLMIRAKIKHWQDIDYAVVVLEHRLETESFVPNDELMAEVCKVGLERSAEEWRRITNDLVSAGFRCECDPHSGRMGWRAASDVRAAK